MPKVVRFSAIIVGWALVVTVVVAIWLHYSTSRGALTIYLTGVVPFAVVAGVLAAVVFAAVRTWSALIVAVAAVLGLLWTQAPLFRAQPAPSTNQVVVGSANLMLGEATAAVLVDRVKTSRIDLLSVQELAAQALANLRAAGIEKELPYSYVVPAPSASGTGIFSRYPIVATRGVANMMFANLAARVTLPGVGPTWFVAIHPVPPVNGRARQWADELSQVAAEVQALTGPVVVAGDFNATWDYAQFRAVASDGFGDATEQSGSGLLFTYPTDKWGRRPFLSLDHVVSRGLVAHNVVGFDIAGSDHRGVVATLGSS